MAVLRKTGVSAKVVSVLINPDGSDLATQTVDSVVVSYSGFDGDNHTGLTRSSCVRVKAQYPVGTEIRNTRQVSIVSSDELAEIARLMSVPYVQPEWVGANLCLSGIPDLTSLQPSSRLLFSGGVSIVVDMENEPCRFPGEIIAQHVVGDGLSFVKAAAGRRGVTGWIEKTGELSTGEAVEVHSPVQRKTR